MSRIGKGKVFGFAAFLILVCCYLAWVAFRFLQIELVVSPTTPRPWQAPIEAFKTPTKTSFPTLALGEKPEDIKLEELKKNSIKFHHPRTTNSSIYDYGRRFYGNKDQVIQLPNGLKIQFVAFATTLPVKEDSNQPRIVHRWYDPVSLKLIKDPESLGLDKDGYYHGKHGFYTAFKLISEFDQLKVSTRYHGATLRNAQNLSLLSSSCSWWSNASKDIQFYRHDRQFYHNAPIDISFAISYGLKESVELDLLNVPLNEEIYFPSQQFAITPLYRGLGRRGSRSYSPNYMTFSWREDKHSFLAIQLSPPSIYSQVNIIRPDRGKRSLHNGIEMIDSIKAAPEANYQFQILSDVAQCQFRIPGVHQLPDSDNLLTVPMGSVKIPSKYDFKQTLERSMGVKCVFDIESDMNVTSFPLHIEDATAQDLLDEIERNFPIRVDTKEFEVRRPAPWGKLKKILGL